MLSQPPSGSGVPRISSTMPIGPDAFMKVMRLELADKPWPCAQAHLLLDVAGAVFAAFRVIAELGFQRACAGRAPMIGQIEDFEIAAIAGLPY